MTVVLKKPFKPGDLVESVYMSIVNAMPPNTPGMILEEKVLDSRGTSKTYIVLFGDKKIETREHTLRWWIDLNQ